MDMKHNMYPAAKHGLSKNSADKITNNKRVFHPPLLSPPFAIHILPLLLCAFFHFYSALSHKITFNPPSFTITQVIKPYTLITWSNMALGFMNAIWNGICNACGYLSFRLFPYYLTHIYNAKFVMWTWQKWRNTFPHSLL